MRRVWCIAVIALACGWCAGAACAEPRAFLLMGHESSFRALPRSGSTVASDLARAPVGVAWLAEGAIAVLSPSGVMEVVDARGRIHRFARLPGSVDESESSSLSVEAAGTLLVAWDGRVWRINTQGEVSPLTPPLDPERSDDFVGGVGAVPDGGFLFTRGSQVFRSLPDGRTEAVAGSGRTGAGRAGPALQSRLEQPEMVAALPAGGFAFSDFGSVVWAVDAAGQMRLLAGGGRATKISRAGRPALSVSLEDIDGIRALPDGQVVLSSLEGVWVVAQARIRKFVQAADVFSVPRGFPPLWSGTPARRAWVVAGGAVDRNAGGEWLIPTETG